jgi:predicted chitinase
MNLTEEQLAAMLPTNKEIAEWCKVLNRALPNRHRQLLAASRHLSRSARHESRDFTAMEENLNYSEKALNQRLRPLLWSRQAQRRRVRAQSRKDRELRWTFILPKRCFGSSENAVRPLRT